MSRKLVQRRRIGEKCGFFRYSPAVNKGLMIKARKLSELNPRILIQST